MKTALGILLTLLFAVTVLSGCNTSSVKPLPEGKSIGVVLMHGKGGMPESLSLPARTLREAGVLVVTPEMPWSRNRIYAKSYEDSMLEIDKAVQQLRAKGASKVFVGGHSIGANAALGYAARRDTISGLILFAPGHVPGIPGYAAKVADGTNKARDLIAKGQGDEPSRFSDYNQGSSSTVSTTANIYLSWFAPEGPAVMSSNAAKVPPNITLFCADGSRERRPRCQYVGQHLSPGIRMEVVSVNAGHGDVPDKAVPLVVEWLRTLDSP